MADRTIIHLRQTPGGFEASVKTYRGSKLVSDEACRDVRLVEVRGVVRLPAGLDSRWTTLVVEGGAEVECSPPLLRVSGVQGPGRSGSKGGAE